MSMPADDDTIEPTTAYWQTIVPADDPAANAPPPYRFGYPARLPDGRFLFLPLRRLPDGRRATASLIANHASFDVVETLSAFMAEAARDTGADVVVGLPTLGLAFAPLVARHLGHTNYVPLGYSRKFWYEERLSEPTRSITTPGQQKSIYLDPNLLPRVAGKRVLVVDDAISSGTTVISVLTLLARIAVEPVAIAVAMRQGSVWREAVARQAPALAANVLGVFDSPILERVESGWSPLR
ncbi:MAG: phosphoribosyltransferase [Acuticoccus sp.]